MTSDPTGIQLRDVELAYGSFVVMTGLNARIRSGEIFVIMGGSGCGKSTLLRAMIGLFPPTRGEIRFGNRSLFGPDGPDDSLTRQFGVMFQNGALWSSMTLAENISLPLEQYTDLRPPEIDRIARLKLALVGLRGFEDYFPSDISGGMRKRASLARALALDPRILFCDEPSAGLDPLSARRLDQLLLVLRDVLGTTIVLVTHELDSIFAIADTALFLDANRRTATAIGPPRELRDHAADPAVRAFLNREDLTLAPESQPESVPVSR